MKRKNICIIGIPEREERQNILKILMAENFKAGGEMNVQIHEVQSIPNRLNPNKATLTQIITKLSKVKDKKKKAF